MSDAERDLDELLGAYALDAVTDEERSAIEEYLALSPRARAEVRDHREVATMLAWTGMNAPDGLWDRIAAQLDDAAPAPSGELASVLSFDTARAESGGPPRARRRRVARTAMAWVAMSAAAALVAVVVVEAVQSNRSGTPSLAAVADVARHEQASTVTELVGQNGAVAGEAIVDHDGHGYLLGGHLPALGSDRTYQLWGVIGGKAISLGVLGNHPDVVVFTTDRSVSKLVVTNEVAGGVVSNGNPDGAYAGTVG